MAMSPSTGTAGGSIQRIDWQTFFAESKVPMVGYDIVSDSIIIVKGADYSADGTGDVLHFDVKSGAWTFGDGRIFHTTDMSNLIINTDGDLLYYESDSNGTIRKWNRAPAASANFSITSRAFDMGQPAMKKRLYKVIVEYIGADAADVDLIIRYDQNTNVAIGSLTSSVGYTTASLDVTPVDFYNVSITFDTAGASLEADFEIGSYSLVYRMKNPK